MAENEIMDVEGAAALLGVTDEYIRRLAREAKIPCAKVGNRWRFVREQIIEWVKAGAPAQAQRLPLGHR